MNDGVTQWQVISILVPQKRKRENIEPLHKKKNVWLRHGADIKQIMRIIIVQLGGRMLMVFLFHFRKRLKYRIQTVNIIIAAVYSVVVVGTPGYYLSGVIFFFPDKFWWRVSFFDKTNTVVTRMLL